MQAPGVDMWNNWQDAVETGCVGVRRIGTGRLHRLRGAEDRTVQVQSTPCSGEVLVKLADHENTGVRASFQRYGRWTTDTLQALAVLGEGAFGVVHLVRRTDTNEFYAVKQMDKRRYQQKNRQHAFAERDVLSEARSRWCVELYATFQDAGNIYMVMEFLQGGDLIGQLQRKGRFTQAETAFYMAELLEALDTVHQCGFIHRDVKPDNIVISITGHLKLLDFGLCKSDIVVDQRELVGESGDPSAPRSAGRRPLHSIVGTPQYMAPESFGGSFGPDSDLWALGIIAFECICGVVPFHSGRHQGPEAIKMIRDKILRHAEILSDKFEKARRLNFTTAESEGFLRRVLSDRDSRLNAAQIRLEPFFGGIDFSALHLMPPPFVPQVSSPEDTSFFDDFRRSSDFPKVGPRIGWDRRLEWAHYELDGKADLAQRSCASTWADESEQIIEV